MEDNSNVATYLEKTLIPARFTFSSKRLNEILETNYDIKILIKNPLFNVHYKRDKIAIIGEDLPNVEIGKFLLPGKKNEYYDIIEKNGMITFQTNGLTPIRWLYMIKDFYWKESIVEPLEKIDFNKIINEIPFLPFNKIVKFAIEPYKYHMSVIIADLNEEKSNKFWRTNELRKRTYGEKEWGTYDCFLTPYTEKILNECSKFESLKPWSDNKQCYCRLAASEGGIYILTDEIITYVNFIKCYIHRNIRNECKGSHKYSLNTFVNLEELTCLYLALKDLGVDVSYKFHRGFY